MGENGCCAGTHPPECGSGPYRGDRSLGGNAHTGDPACCAATSVYASHNARQGLGSTGIEKPVLTRFITALVRNRRMFSSSKKYSDVKFSKSAISRAETRRMKSASPVT